MTPTPSEALAARIERALNVLQPLCHWDYLFTAPNAAPGCELRISDLRSAIAALRPGPPEGIAEPTREMERAGALRAQEPDIRTPLTFADCAKIYRAMLAAASSGGKGED